MAKISDCAVLMGGDYTVPTLTNTCYVTSIHGRIRETVKTSPWILMDDAVRDRVRENSNLILESLKTFK